jgi:hypothetical protein
MNDAAWALLALAVEDSYSAAGAPTEAPAPDPRITAQWDIVGFLTGQDALLADAFTMRAERVFYGYLLRSKTDPTQQALVIRGTHGFVEWIIDAVFAPRRAHPVAGEVETGFYGLAQTLRINGAPAAQAITTLCPGGVLTIAGHSLGAALAQILAFDIEARRPVGLRLIASPHAGDGTFATALAARVTPDSIGYASPFDIVTHVPEFFGYAAFPRTLSLPRNPTGYRISLTPAAQHHCLSYALRLDPTLDLAALPPCDAGFAASIRKI